MSVPEMDALFALADMARKEVDRAEGVDEPDEEDDGEVLFVNPTKPIRTGKPTITQTSDGDFHVCFGLQCPHAELRRGYWTCAITGHHLGVEPKGSSDPSWTGRSTGSANPDDAAGTPTGGWIKRRDMFSASTRAWETAASIQAAALQRPLPDAAAAAAAATAAAAAKPRSSAAPQARRALRRRARGVRRGGGRRRARARPLRAPAGGQAQGRGRHGHRQALIVDAASAPATSADAASGAKRQSSIRGSKTSNLCARRRSSTFGTAAPERRGSASRRCTTSASTPTSLCASSASWPGQRGRDRDGAARAATAGHVRELIASLIVNLWQAACLTPHMRSNKKGNDSFRPFAAGILYSFKRGLYLSDGTCVVPELATLTASLPALRSTQSTPAAKQLQSSSHRGICSFHRSISSAANLPPAEAAIVRRRFLCAAQQAAMLRELVFSIDGKP